jgi:hypothetical protein
MRQPVIVSRALFLFLAVGFVAGCGTSEPETVPVTGVVTLDGQPVDGAAVVLMSQVAGSGNAARAVTNADGTFTLATFKDDDGVRPGQYKAIVKKADLLPSAYGSLESTPFDVEVKPGMDLPLKLDLTSE